MFGAVKVATSRLGISALVALTAAICSAGCGKSKGGGKFDGQERSAPSKGEEAARRAGPSDELERIIKESSEEIKRRSWPKAVKLIGEGIDLAQKGGTEFEIQRARLLLMLGDVNMETGMEAEARRYLVDAMAIFHVRDHAEGRLRTLLSMCRIEEKKGDYAAAARQLAEAEALVPKIDDKKLKADLKVHSGRLASRQMKHQDAYDAFAEAIRVYDVAKAKSEMAETLILLAAEEDELERISACRLSLEKAGAIFREIGDLKGEAVALHRLAGLAEREGKYSLAKDLLKKARDLYVKLDDRSAAAGVERHINSLPSE